MLITGNKDKALAHSLYKLYPVTGVFASRETGYDLTNSEGQNAFAEKALEHDVIINCAALWKFNQTTLLNILYKKCIEHNHTPHIINIGSTTDRIKRGTDWLYNAEKKALRDYSNSLSIMGVWDNKPKVSYISFGTLTNNQEKHPGRKCLDIDEAAQYIKWLISQPKYVNINEISIDPMQSDNYYE
jgi:NADP-dependent 3-hydroxy acid dehydrogenase YdfG